MAFPTTSVLDTFTQANGALSANWTAPFIAGGDVPTVNTNMMIGPSPVLDPLTASAYWNVSTFGPDSEVYATVPASATSSEWCILFLRAQNMGTGTYCAYRCFANIGSDALGIYRWYNNAQAAVVYEDAQTMAVGDKWGFSAVTSGTDIILTAYRDSGAGFVQVIQVTDTNVISGSPLLGNAGYIAAQLYGSGSTTRALDDFGGGTLVPPEEKQSFYITQRRSMGRR